MGIHHAHVVNRHTFIVLAGFHSKPVNLIFAFYSGDGIELFLRQRAFCFQLFFIVEGCGRGVPVLRRLFRTVVIAALPFTAFPFLC